MRLALFVGCCIPDRLPGYEASARSVLAHLGVQLVDLAFDCCGYPSRDRSPDSLVFASARNLALAGGAGVGIVTLCTCCFGTLRRAVRIVDEDSEIRGRVDRALLAEGLVRSRGTTVDHLLSLVARTIGVEAVAAAVRSPCSGIRVAAQYGCQALRPSDLAGIDDPMNPTMFEKLIEATGAIAVDWPLRLECCGAPVCDANATIARRMTGAKLADAKAAGADAICTVCPHCHLRFDEAADAAMPGTTRPLLLTQLLGLAMGLPAQTLGMNPVTSGRHLFSEFRERERRTRVGFRRAKRGAL